MTDETQIAPPEGDEVSLRDELANALTAQGDTPDVALVETPAAPVQDTKPRDEAGRFAKQTEAAQPKPSEPKTPQAGAEPQPQAGTITPPASWSATAKADFAALPQHIQQEVLKREADIEAGKAQWDQKAERFNRLDAILAPRRERFQLAGIDETQAVQALFAAQDYLERDPVNALIYLARQSGVSQQHLLQVLGGPQQPQQAQLPPQLQPLMQQVQTLSQTVAQQQAQQTQAKLSEHLNQVQAFAADPANIYFENVRARMGKLIRSGDAENLSDAYQQACWMDPEIRPLMLRQQTQQQAVAQQAEARAKAEAARRASGSVIGSPSPGATPVQGGSSGNLREDIQAAWNAHA